MSIRVEHELKSALVVLAVAKQPGNAAVVRTTASKAATFTRARVAIAMKLIDPSSTDIAGPEPNTLMIVHAAPEKEERSSNSNRGSDEAGIAVAFDNQAQEQLDTALQQKGEEIDVAALAKKKPKLEEKKKRTAAVSDRGEKKNEAAGARGYCQE